MDRDHCTFETCSLERYGWYTYVPNIGANVTYLVIFAVFAMIQTYLSVRYRVWGMFAIGLVAGCLAEVIGYAGRVLESRGNGIYVKKYFVINLVCLTIAPALISAPVYLSLGRVIKAYGNLYSLLKPKTYAIIFICSDVISLVLQAAGGALAATAKDQKKTDAGVHLLVAGLAFQVLSLFVFIGLSTHLWVRIKKGVYFNTRYQDLRSSGHFRRFIYALIVATITIQIRCIFRVVELSDGFRSHLANDQIAFMILDGPMIMIAVGALTVCHPGPLFLGAWNQLGNDSGEVNGDIEQNTEYQTMAESRKA